MNSQSDNNTAVSATVVKVALLTGGDDRPYALGLATSLIAQGVFVDFIGSDNVDGPELHGSPLVSFLNLRGDQSESAGLRRKVFRLLAYYCRLFKYAATAKPRVFHILWHNKFEWFDRTLLLLYYRMLGRKIVFTAHNVNAAKRDACDTAFNRLTLGIQYRLVHHVFVHTQLMKDELLGDFAVPAKKVSVIPFGINDSTPVTESTGVKCRQLLGLERAHKVVLFFGQIAPYKGLEYLVAALAEMVQRDPMVRLVIAGKVKKGNDDYWRLIANEIEHQGLESHIVIRGEHIPDAEVEIFFKAADVLAIPYVHIFQSGVPFLAYNFGLPVVATDVGALREVVEEGETGFIARPMDSKDLAQTLEKFFQSPLGRDVASHRARIREWASKQHSWAGVAATTKKVYSAFL